MLWGFHSAERLLGSFTGAGAGVHSGKPQPGAAAAWEQGDLDASSKAKGVRQAPQEELLSLAARKAGQEQHR